MRLLDATLVAAVVHEVEGVFPEGFEVWLALHGISRATGYRHLARIRAEGKWSERSRRPRSSPQTCGKVERAHRTFKEWLAGQPTPSTTLQELQAACDAYRAWYNTQRRHSAVGSPPQAAWDAAVELGGPTNLPVQQDADVVHRRVNVDGRLYTANTRVTIGRARAGQEVTAVRDRAHVTVYDINGTPIGDLLIDPSRFDQGKLRPAPAA